ncbi:MAG TPA: peptide chain release factor N(5)-glutamine methyltransferase [Candidatus Acidoferrales bacterium]|nr:peptide chain release factor N(5)-glutamine methyltransferase [Candidatus Acidoferrales bacterium]
MSHLPLRALLCDAIARLERERVPSAPLAAELLLMHTLGQDRAWIYAHPETEIDPAVRERYLGLVMRRAKGEPTQHLTGHQEFWGLDFEVTPDVLIPRPETEHLVEVALDRLGVGASYAGDSLWRELSSNGQTPQAKACATELRIADVGTGSGCIAIALARELPAAEVVAIDVSPAALEVARRNASRHGVASRVRFFESNLLDVVLPGTRDTSHGSRSFDLIVSNPPYIGRDEAESLPREVREHEPESALFGGETGLEIYAPLIAQAAALLKPGGWLVLELGHRSAQRVLSLLGTPQWMHVKLTNDLAGIARVASAERGTL